jgi:hypothetical protein
MDRQAQVAGVPAELAGLLPADPSRVEMVLQQQWEIANLRLKTAKVEGNEAKLTFQDPESAIEFEHPWPQPILPPQGGGAFFLANAAQFLDEPGEWYQEMPSGRMLYWPREGEDMTKAKAVAPGLETLLKIEGTLDRPVSNVSVTGIGFQHTSWQALR